MLTKEDLSGAVTIEVEKGVRYRRCLSYNIQVRVEGLVQKISNEESEQYFHSRPRDIQIAPALGNQSSVITGRELVHQQYKELDEKYPEGSKIPMPQYWGGYRLIPERFEFWQGDELSVHPRSHKIANTLIISDVGRGMITILSYI